MSERIFLPLVDKIKKAGAKIQGSTFVTDVITDATGKVTINVRMMIDDVSPSFSW